MIEAEVEKNSVQLSQFIAANVDKVFRAWTDAKWLCQWFAPGDMTVPHAEVDASEGGKYRIEMLNPDNETFITYGEYKQVVKNKKLVFSWGWEGPDRYETEVIVEFEAVDGGTLINLQHLRHRNGDVAANHSSGWVGIFVKLVEKIDSF